MQPRMSWLSWTMFAVVLAAAAALVIGFLVSSAGPSSTATPAPTPVGPTRPPASEPPGAHVLVGAGDIAACGSAHDDATAALVEGIAGTVFTAGDNAYESGTVEQYRDCYGPSWGRFKDRTRPVPGNHEYQTPGAAGYFEYFGAAAGDPARPWYAYDLGEWRVYALDSNCDAIGGCGSDSPEVAWLADDLTAQPRNCVLAYWHHPRFSSGRHGNTEEVQPIWATLADAGADVIVAGHDHLYERFAPIDAAGVPSPDGMRSFVIGTGGKNLYEFHDIQPGSEVREAATFGVLALTLRDGSYEWRFVPAEGRIFTDSGSAMLPRDRRAPRTPVCGGAAVVAP